MAVKYTIPYRSTDDTPWRVDILHDAYNDAPISVRGHGDRCCTIEYDGGVDDPFDNPVVSSKALLELINNGELDMDELQEAGDRDFVVEVYRDNALKWKGYLVTDNIQQPFLSAPYVVQLSAIDGLNMLEGISYTHNNLQTQSLDIAVRAPLNFLRQVLFAQSNLGLMLPIRWYVGLENVETEDDPIAGLMTWSPYGEGIIAGEYVDGSGNIQYIYQNCRYILEGLVKCMKGARIFQADGAWNIFPPIDIIGGAFTYNECEATLALPTITQHTVDINRTVVGSREPGGDYSFIREDALITVKPALSKVDVRYEADRSENILPNGGFDTETVGINWSHWGFITNPSNYGSIEQYESLNGRPGSAVQLTLDGNATNTVVFTLLESGEIAGVPLDANILFKRITWGFTLMPTNYGFSYDGEETIDWSNRPFAVSLRYTVQIGEDTRVYYLNEFGYWQFEARGIGLGVVFVNMQVELIPPSPPTPASYMHHAIYEGTPNVGDVLVIEIGGVDYSFAVTVLEEGNLELALNELMDALPSSVAGFNIVNKAVIMDSATKGSVRFQYAVQVGAATGRTYKSGATQEFRLIFPEIQGLKIWDVASFVFQGKAGSNEILMPDPGFLGGDTLDTVGKLDIRFRVMPGQRYVLDDVWVNVEDNNDVYRASTGEHGNSQSITLGISSSFSGFMVSNLMRSFNTSNTDFLWSDGTVEASLTEHYARAVMRWRYKPSRIFNGTINTRTKDWSFLEIYAFSGLTGNYVPLRAQYNTELCEVNLIAMEGRNDGTGINIQHYASNNMPLSNYGG